MMRRSSCFALALLTLLAGLAEAKPRKYSWEINPFIGSRDYDSSLDGLSTNGVYGIRLGYNLSRHWEVEAGWNYDRNNHDRSLFRQQIDVEHVDLGAVFNMNTGPDEHETYGRWMSWDR